MIKKVTKPPLSDAHSSSHLYRLIYADPAVRPGELPGQNGRGPE